MLSDEYFMQLAYNEALNAQDEGEVPIGAVVVCDSVVVAKAHNMTERLNDSTAHAEMLAITAAMDYLGSKYLKDCTLYVTLEPCVMCAGALAWSQIGRIVFGAFDQKKGYQSFAPNCLHPKTQVDSGIMEVEIAELLRSFFAQRRH
ncbi:MAG: nucleoside deaminase [Bacteroidales bacterium]|nr:nucleoside deaminase [Bacteroidales bacterium]